MLIILVIMALTIFMSWRGFNNYDVIQKLSFRPDRVSKGKETYRILSHGLVHADWNHLIINMLVLFSFAGSCARYYTYIFGEATIHMFVLYVGAIMFSSLYSLYQHRNNPYYSSIGASGAVNAVVFNSIFFDPWNKIYFFGILPIPGVIFGILYLIYSMRMSKRNNDNIGHDAHIMGAIFGFLYPVIAKPELLMEFIGKLSQF